ncbi:MAG: response regulator transcription factor [Faecalicatena sp.]|uniref:response regulator transcription factor n=1 Tax=Faecalicatena sp. TaxID=2005360 RepID=UPI00258B28C9|nr:response regulator transcription factor [Faecalicatena sp.]MCI6468042.1 response regulator transcription factor [Faecalicatena sp.]MDY5618520.1 response regulator transcription factor [Lachnospiraceae bacterium]
MYKIMLVEDDVEINGLLSGFLKENGYKVLCLYDGLHVLDCLNENKIDLILLDIMLPYCSGDIVLAKIRRQSTIPVIIISAKEMTQNKIDLLRLGADDYITKPFDMEEVLARIESNLRRVQFQCGLQGCLQYDGLELDLERNTAILQGIELSLTAKEFSILELLMKFPEKVFSKANLFQSVWNMEYISEDNTLNVHISNLRNKLKAVCPDREYIDTVWGIGYRLHKAKG